jgi:hypothetical protein
MHRLRSNVLASSWASSLASAAFAACLGLSALGCEEDTAPAALFPDAAPKDAGASDAVAATDATDAAPTGGFVTGAADMHCGVKKQATSAASCHPDGGAAETDAGEAGDGGEESEYGATLFNSEGDDDDCKYHVVASASSPIAQNMDVTFTVVVTKTADGMAATMAGVSSEVFLSPTHLGMVPAGDSTETPPGTYKIGPVRFDMPGQWTVRFHMYEGCSDLADDSPHGHVAFFVNVP